ncbi:MAG: FAD-dependent oxidoreductase [Nitrospira sp.]|nr:FAD-dependent oxidoreductase [Nitrospira sp.]
MTGAGHQTVLVLGGGPAGLAAAYYLAEQGLRVVLLDQASSLGGGFVDERQPPPALLGCHHATWRLLAALGSTPRSPEFQQAGLEFRLPGGRIVRYPHSRFPTPLHSLFTIGRFAGLSWSARWRLLSWLEELWEGSSELGADLEHRTAQEWLTSLGHEVSLQQAIWNPLAQWLTGSDLRMLSADALTGALTPVFLRRSSDSRIMIPLRSPNGFFIEPVVDRLRRGEATLRLETQASQLLYHQERVTGIRLVDGTVLEADWYVSAISYRRLTALLPERWLTRFSYFQQLSELTPISRGVVRLAARTVINTPRFMLLSEGPFQRVQAQSTEDRHTRFTLVRSHDGNRHSATGEQAADLLRATGLLDPSTVVPTIVSDEVGDSALSLTPGTKVRRPIQTSPIANLLIAGAWTDTGWPANLESAIVSGERCAAIISGKGLPAY